MKEINLSISIVVYKSDINVLAKALRDLHSGLRGNKTLKTTLYVIDNSCSSIWNEKISKCIEENFSCTEQIAVQLVISPNNIGYGRANNLILNHLNSDYHLVMNPDVFISTDAISAAIDYMEKNIDIGLLTPAVFGEDGAQHFLCKRNPTLFIMFLRSFAPHFLKRTFADYMNRFEMKDRDYSKVINDIPYPTGCFMFFRTTIFLKLNGFSPKFFMYLEDADIGRRLLKISRSAYVPNVKIIHKWTRGSHNSFKLRWITIKSVLVYWWMWGGLF